MKKQESRIVEETDAIAIAQQFLEEVRDSRGHAFKGSIESVLKTLNALRHRLWEEDDNMKTTKFFVHITPYVVYATTKEDAMIVFLEDIKQGADLQPSHVSTSIEG